MSEIILGGHISTAGQQYCLANQTAEDFGFKALQIFVGSPQTTKVASVDDKEAEAFRLVSRNKVVIIHTNYTMNLAHPDLSFRGTVARSIFTSMQRAAQLGADYTVSHCGSHKGDGHSVGLKRMEETLDTISTLLGGLPLQVSPNHGSAADVKHLLEATPGRGTNLSRAINNLIPFCERFPWLGLCIDTAHLWGAGYNINNPKVVDYLYDLLHEHVKVIHLNDTEVDLDSGRDLHCSLGTGQIKQWSYFIEKWAGVPMILERDKFFFNQDIDYLKDRGVTF